MSRKSRTKAQKKRRELQKKSGRHTFSPFHLLNAELPTYGTWMLNIDLRKQGITNVIIARKMIDGNLAFGSFLIDVWGIGLKDCFGDIGVPPRRFEREMLNKHSDVAYRPCNLDYAQRLIWDGVEHATKYGFKTPKEFRDWRKIVGQPAADTSPIEFGKDGELLVIGEIDDIAKRMGTTPEKAMERINQHGHFVSELDPDGLPEELVGIDEEMEIIDEVDDSEVDLVVEPESRRRIVLPSERPAQKK